MRAKEELPECSVATAVSLIGGKWKLLILRNLKERPWRFNELQRSIDGISQKVLTDSLFLRHSIHITRSFPRNTRGPRGIHGASPNSTYFISPGVPCQDASGAGR